MIIIILGKHVSIKGGIDKAFARAREINCNSLQIFSKNPRGWKGREIPSAEIKKVKQERNRWDMSPLVVHSTYLINIASPEKKLLEKSRLGLEDDYTRSGKIGADYLVLHPGSHKGEGLEAGINRIVSTLNRVLKNVKNECIILLENVAGAGNSIGASFEQINQIIKNIENNARVGICLDTCHAFAAGYDVSTSSGLKKMLTEIKKYNLLKKLKIIHINDSKFKLGSNKDQHTHIGEGYIGVKGIENIVNYKKMKDLPFILETPAFAGKDKDVEIIYSLRKKGE